MSEQKKNSFDKATLVKIGKSALLSGAGAAGLVILTWVGELEVSNPLLVSLIAVGIPWGINTIKEFIKGQ